MPAARALSYLHALLRLPVPAAATPLAVATLAMLVVQSMDHQYVRTHQTLALVITGFLVLLFVALYRALAPATLKLVQVGQRWLTMGLIVLMAGNTLLHIAMSYDHLSRTDRYTNDAVAVTDCATHLFLRGANPYKNVHMLTCLDSHGLDAFSTTPLQAPNGPFWRFRSYPSPMSGGLKWLWYRTYKRELYLEQHDPSYVAHDFESRFNYPGGAILIATPVLVLGFRDLLPLYLGCTVLASILICRRAERRIRWVVGLLLLGDTPLLLDGLGGLTDATYALFLTLYWFSRDRALTAGLWLGLAAATRQQAWFFIPFLLYLGWRRHGWADLRLRAGAALAVFAGCNLPFILLGPGDWLAGLLGPLHDPMFALGVGLVVLSIAKVLPLWAAATYLKLELAAYALAFGFYTRCWRRMPALALLLPLIPMAFAWRSLHTYFLFLPMLATAALADQSRRAPAASTPDLIPDAAGAPTQSRVA